MLLFVKILLAAQEDTAEAMRELADWKVRPWRMVPHWGGLPWSNTPSLRRSCKNACFLLKARVEDAKRVTDELSGQAVTQDEAKAKAQGEMTSTQAQLDRYHEHCTQDTLNLEVRLHFPAPR